MKAVKTIKNFIEKHPPEIIIDSLTNHKLRWNTKMIDENITRFDWLRKNLQDNISKNLLDRVILYRKTGDYAFLHEFCDITLNQYFDPIMKFNTEEIFIDCGGFISDSTQNFIRRNPEFHHVYIYEPEPYHYKLCEKFVGKNPKITIYNKAIGNENATLLLKCDGSQSNISKKGDVEVKVVRLDDDLAGVHPTYVKMDLEGYEMEALKGMTRIMKEDKPKLAICIYHKPFDVLEIPEFIKSVNPDYKFDIRQYISCGTSDSELVLYAY